MACNNDIVEHLLYNTVSKLSKLTLSWVCKVIFHAEPTGLSVSKFSVLLNQERFLQLLKDLNALQQAVAQNGLRIFQIILSGRLVHDRVFPILLLWRTRRTRRSSSSIETFSGGSWKSARRHVQEAHRHGPEAGDQ